MGPRIAKTFRSRGLKVGFYYCFPGDYSAGIPGEYANEKLADDQPDLHGLPPEAAGDYAGFIKKQLAELLSKYGDIDLLWCDQYANKYTKDQWQDIKAYIKSLQPRCIVLGNNARRLTDSDILGYEFPWQSALPRSTDSLFACRPDGGGRTGLGYAAADRLGTLRVA